MLFLQSLKLEHLNYHLLFHFDDSYDQMNDQKRIPRDYLNFPPAAQILRTLSGSKIYKKQNSCRLFLEIYKKALKTFWIRNSDHESEINWEILGVSKNPHCPKKTHVYVYIYVVKVFSMDFTSLAALPSVNAAANQVVCDLIP